MARSILSSKRNLDNYYIALTPFLEAKVNLIVEYTRSLKPKTLLFPVPYTPIAHGGKYDLSALVRSCVKFTCDQMQNNRSYDWKRKLAQFLEDYETIRNAPLKAITAPHQEMDADLEMIAQFLVGLGLQTRPASNEGAPNRKALLTLCVLVAHDMV